MKSNVFMLALILLSCASPKESTNAKGKGNGKIITQTIKVSEYDAIEIGPGINCDGNIGKKGIPTFNYTQSKGNASLEITTDSNILPLLEITSSNGILKIACKERNARLQPTRLLIAGKSKDLRDLKVSGCMDFHLQNNLSTKKLTIKGSGASDIYMHQKVSVDAIEITVSGSGDLVADQLIAGFVECKVSGAGDVTLKGKTSEGRFRVSGSGDIKAFDMEVRNLDCAASGSGDARVYATNTLNARASGSGDIYYKGNASVDKHTSGSGSVRKN